MRKLVTKKNSTNAVIDVATSDGIRVMCPMRSTKNTQADCSTACAWFNQRPVTDDRSMGAFCGDKFIGNT